MRIPIPVRWIALTIFVFSAVLNYLDRQVLATMSEIWQTGHQFTFTPSDYGRLVQYFSIAYAATALFIGSFIDRIGLNRGATIAVAVWGVASSARACRTAWANCCFGASCWAQRRRAA
jgi:ACS family hexuronate transporter-like MFS transporter